MQHREIKAMMAELAPVIRDYVARETAPLVGRIGLLEARPAPRESVGLTGAVKNENGILILTLSDGNTIDTGIRDGKDVANSAVETIVEAAAKAIEERLVVRVGTEVEQLPRPKDGASVTVEDVRPLVEETVTRTLSEMPKAKDVSSLLIDRKGELVATLSDGTTRGVGQVVGRDADMDAIREEVKAVLDAALAEFPVPKDGKDGFGFEDLSLSVEERGVFLRFVRGDEVKEFRLPVVLDRGVFKDGTAYEPGDTVTFGGSLWIAQESTTEKPGIGKGWRLSVKRGRDGKDGKDKA